jgi:AcrR family transcriptional regulator
MASKTRDTRTRILDTALDCFLELGIEQTTTALVIERSGASNGALFHHFPNKEALADAIYVEAIASFQEGLWELLGRRPRTLRAAVRGVIAHQVEWIEANPERARFVYLRGTLDWETSAGARIEEMNQKLSGAFRDWMAPLIERGEVRPTSMVVVNAIVTGPVHALGRRWLAGQLDAPLRSHVDELADAACAGLKGAPFRGARGTSRSRPSRGRVRLQVVAEDGQVLAEGEATAELRPSAGSAAA